MTRVAVQVIIGHESSNMFTMMSDFTLLGARTEGRSQDDGRVAANHGGRGDHDADTGNMGTPKAEATSPSPRLRVE